MLAPSAAPIAGPLTPRTAELAVVLMLMSVAAVGTPADQLLPTVQSLHVAPVQAVTCAEAEPADMAVNAAADALASSKRSNSVRLRAEAGRVRFGLLCHMSSGCRRIVATPMHSRMGHSSFDWVHTVRG